VLASILHANQLDTVTTREELASFSEGFVPTNTKANTQWAVRNFNTWADWRFTCTLEPNDLGSRMVIGTHHLFEFAFVRFKEAHEEPATPNFLDDKDDRFAGLRGTRDVIAQRLREDGVHVSASVKHAATHV
jgi:hypothetical protein